MVYSMSCCIVMFALSLPMTDSVVLISSSRRFMSFGFFFSEAPATAAPLFGWIPPSPCISVTKLFSSALVQRLNKLECLSVASFFPEAESLVTGSLTACPHLLRIFLEEFLVGYELNYCQAKFMPI